MSRTDEIDKIVDEIGDADSLYEFAECVYEDRQRIAELEEQLDEKEKEIRQLDNEKGMLLNNSMKLLKEKDDRLKSQPAEIVEKIKNYKGEYFEWKIGDKIYPAFKITEEDLDNILKEYQK